MATMGDPSETSVTASLTPRPPRVRIPLRRGLRWLLIVLVAAFLVWSLVEPRLLVVRYDTVSSPDVPPAFEGTRIAYIADVHAGPYYSRDRVARLVDKVNALKPDVVLIGGDNVGGKSHGARNFYPEAARLRAPLGVFGVLGNHEYREGVSEARRDMLASGIVLIDNDNVSLLKNGQRVKIGGVDDLLRGKPDVSKAGRGVAPEDFAILLTHNPDLLATQLPFNPRTWDVSLAGHLHAGQITFFGLWAPIVPSEYGQRYRAGWRKEQGTLILDTNGVGEVTAPLRFFAPPEVHLITLRQGEAAEVVRQQP